MKVKTLILLVLFLGVANNCYSNTQDKLINEVVKQEVQKSVRGIKKTELKYNEQSKRDPFRSYIKSEKGNDQKVINIDDTTTVACPDFKIQGIICSPKKSQAIINEKIFRVGDTIDGFRIIEINKDKVVGNYMNRKFEFDSPAVSVSSKKSLKNIKEEK